MTDVAVVIAWRDNGDAVRQANLARVLDHLCEWNPDYPIQLSDDGRESGPFNRSAAYNRGMAKTPADVYVFHEADMLVPFDQLDQAVQVAATSPGLVVPFGQYYYLSAEDSRRLLTETFTPEPLWTMQSIGPVNVLSAESMRLVGQWDETLSGHGYDDNCMERAFRVACQSPTHHVGGPAWHLWHEMAYAPWERGTPASDPENFSEAEVAATEWNRNRLKKYQRAVHPHEVRTLTTETRLWQ